MTNMPFDYWSPGARTKEPTFGPVRGLGARPMGSNRPPYYCTRGVRAFTIHISFNSL